MALGRDGWRVVYEERAKAWTEAPPPWAPYGGSVTAGATAPCMPCGNTEVPSCSQARRASWVAAAGEPAALPGPPSAARPGDRRVRGIRSDYLDPLRIIGLL